MSVIHSRLNISAVVDGLRQEESRIVVHYGQGQPQNEFGNPRSGYVAIDKNQATNLESIKVGQEFKMNLNCSDILKLQIGGRVFIDKFAAMPDK